MCLSYSKLPTEEVAREEKREKTTGKIKTKKQIKWRKGVKKAAEQVCDFLFGDLFRLPDTVNDIELQNSTEVYSAIYAMGGLGYYV